MFDPNSAADWAEAYSGSYPDRQESIYGEDPIRWLMALMTLPTAPLVAGQPIVFIGSGLGRAAQIWTGLGLGIGPIVCIDNSTIVQGWQAQGKARWTVLNEDGATNASRRNIRQAAGLTGAQKFAWGISEDVLPGKTDAEIAQLRSVGLDFCTRLAHIVTFAGQGTDQGAGFIWRTLAQCKALVTPDIVISRDGFQVL